MNIFNIKRLILSWAVLSVLCGMAIAQIEEYEIHDRGMLWETMFNDGLISRNWNDRDTETNVPLMEWPARSRTYINGILYYGMHNNTGGGINIGVSLKGKQIGRPGRKYAFCGAVGSGEVAEVITGQWAFPIGIKKVNNFPLVEDQTDPKWGELNPAYNPKEAEQIITAKFSTSTGITVTRTSRVWSYPDYDDMIVMEYELENTGDLDGNLATTEQTDELRDVLVAFEWGPGPSNLGFTRYYGFWKYDGGYRKGDNWGPYDYNLWLLYSYNERTFTNDPTLWGKPEPDPANFLKWAKSGENFGGLYSPQAPGHVILYYDSEHLAHLDPNDPNFVTNESETVFGMYKAEADGYGYKKGDYIRIDKNGHLKQPWVVKSQDNTQQVDRKMGTNRAYTVPYSDIDNVNDVIKIGDKEFPCNDPDRWLGRGALLGDYYKPSTQATSFGPYTLKKGEKLEFSIAECVGFLETPGRRIRGGPKRDYDNTIDWDNRPIKLSGQTVTSHYLTDFGYPDYVNSKVRTVHDVALKVHRAYLGKEPTIPVWPESNPKDGSYSIPVPPPAPPIKVSNTATGDVKIVWKRAVENFTHTNLTGKVAKFIVYTAVHPAGPWKQESSVNVGQSLNAEGNYEVMLDPPGFKVGEKLYFSVVSEDAQGNRSGRTNHTELTKNIGSVAKLSKVHVVPNPFKVVSGFTGGDAVKNQIGFYGLPSKCTIRVFSFAGQLIQTIEHDADLYSEAWFQVTRNNQLLASGVYYYVVTTPEGEKTSGKFLIIR